MKRWGGFFLMGLGFLLWYAGGRSGNSAYVNLGIASLILGIVLLSLFYDENTGDSSPLCSPYCDFLERLLRDANPRGKPVVIPPYENLPEGGILFPPRDNHPIGLGRLDRNGVLLQDGSLLVSPPPGWGVVKMATENAGDLSGVGVGYASSAVLAALNTLGAGGGEVFELEDSVEVYVRYSCAPSIFDPAVGAVLVSVALGARSLYSVESVEHRNDHLRIELRPLGGIERWL